MSGFDPETGIFELNWTKINRYLSHRFQHQIPDNLEKFVEELIKQSPYIYLGKNIYGFKLVANDAQIWELLSGKPAEFGQTEESPEVTYNKWRQRKVWFNSTDLGKELNPKIGAVKVNRMLEKLSYIERKDGGWIPTAYAEKSCLVRARETAQVYGNNPCVELNRNLIPILQDII